MGSSPACNTTNKFNRKHILKQNQQLKLQQKQRRYVQQELPINQDDLQKIKQIMKGHCLFCHIPNELMESFIVNVTKWKYYSGRYIYRQNDVSSSLYFIKDGGVYFQVYCDIIKTLSEGDYFGHDSLCFDDPRSESIRVASKQVVLYELHKDHVTDLFRKYMRSYRSQIDSIFSRIHFFNYLTNKIKQILIQNTFLFRLNQGEKLFEKEQNANSFFIIKKGSVRIQIVDKQDLIMKEGDYFGESAFFTLDKNHVKNQRMGRASANCHGTEVYGVGLSLVRKQLDQQVRSIIFFNQQKWTLFRDPILNSFKTFDCNFLIQLFNVREAKKFSILAKRQTKPEYLYIPLQTQINTNNQLKLYCSEFLKEQNQDKLLTEDIVLTRDGYYAYALISQFKQVLGINKLSVVQNNKRSIKISKEPIFKILSLSLRNISQYSKKLTSSAYSTVLIVQDLKFGSEFVLKIYRKKKRSNNRNNSLNESKITEQALICPSVLKNSKTFISRNALISIKQNLGSLNSELQRSQHKNLEGDLSKVEVDQALFQNEKEIISNLNSPLICGYYKAQQDEKHYYLFLQYIKGLTLDEIMVEFGMIPQSVVKYILAYVSVFLDHLHSKNIIYRNLNPSNIIMKNNGHLVITDFSCAKKLNQNGRTNTVAGVPYYMAPEVVRQDEYGFNADIWSMGIVLYEMMSGSLPFGEKAKQVLDIYESIINDDLNLRKIRNKPEKMIIKALLDKDPATRIQSAMQIRQFSYINDVQFDWPQFLAKRMKPFYFPIKKSFNYTNFNNYEIFDASTVVDWI